MRAWRTSLTVSMPRKGYLLFVRRAGCLGLTLDAKHHSLLAAFVEDGKMD